MDDSRHKYTAFAATVQQVLNAAREAAAQPEGPIKYARLGRSDLRGGRERGGLYTWPILCTLAIRENWNTGHALFSPREKGRTPETERGTWRALGRLERSGRIARRGKYTWELIRQENGRPIRAGLVRYAADNPGAGLAVRALVALAFWRGEWGAMGLREIRADLGCDTGQAAGLAAALRALAENHTRDEIRALVFYSRFQFRRNDGRPLHPFTRREGSRRPIGRPRQTPAKARQGWGGAVALVPPLPAPGGPGALPGGPLGASARPGEQGGRVCLPGRFADGQPGREGGRSETVAYGFLIAFRQKNKPVIPPPLCPPPALVARPQSAQEGKRGRPVPLGGLLDQVIAQATSGPPGRATAWQGPPDEYHARRRSYYAAKAAQERERRRTLPAAIWSPSLADVLAAVPDFAARPITEQARIVADMIAARKAGRPGAEGAEGPRICQENGGPRSGSYPHFQGGAGLAETGGNSAFCLDNEETDFR